MTEAIHGASLASHHRSNKAADAMAGRPPTDHHCDDGHAEYRLAVGGCSPGPILATRGDKDDRAVLPDDAPGAPACDPPARTTRA